MTNPIITICDLLSGETIIREMTDAEFAVYKADQLANQPVVEEVIIDTPVEELPAK